MTPEKAKEIAIAITSSINEVLDVPGIKLIYESKKSDNYFGSHDCQNMVIYVNKTYFDNYAKYDGVGDFTFNFAFFAGIIAHETRHFYQSRLNDSTYNREIEKESHYYQNMHAIPTDEYNNLSIEIDAHAFQALVEEEICSEHFPIPRKMNMEKFEQRYSELEKEYAEKIHTVFTKAFNLNSQRKTGR